MKKMLLAFATIVFALMFTTVAFVQEGERRVSGDTVPLTLNDARGRPISLESLAPEDQAQIERIKKAAASLGDEPGTTLRKWKITIHCEAPPLKCSVIISKA